MQERRLLNVALKLILDIVFQTLCIKEQFCGLQVYRAVFGI